ncbi:MAG: hypothetical protein JXB18_12175 [Sedimentisphaerales bacterium]|nr:hypothetical protein [Sedimentisphaerales bacterium]
MKRFLHPGHQHHRGIALIAAMIFLAIFASLSVGFLSLSSANTQMAANHKAGNNALNAALSGLDCALYVAQKASTTNPLKTGYNYVSTTEADTMWSKLCTQLQTVKLGNVTVPSAIAFTDAGGTGMRIRTPAYIPCQSGGAFQISFSRYSSDPKAVIIQVTGADGGVTRALKLNLSITKDATVMNYALAGRGRMWITGDTTIHGSIYSSWDRASISPFNMTPDSSVEGTINTVLSKDTVMAQSYQLETLDSDGNPMFDADGNRIYTSADEIQGDHQGINYGVPDQSNIPGLSIGDYNTSMYKNAIPATTVSATGSLVANGKISTSGITKVREYFPHAAGNYSQPASSGSRTLDRYKYENKTFRNVVLNSNNNALFKNCTFEEVLYVDCSTSTSSYYNNVRFENCTFNGVIITNTPSSLNWQANCLYFTGTATFQNNSSIPEATILAPHFNVNLGNTNPNTGDNNLLTGAIVGGIVDVRGNAQIYGTIISMADTTNYTSGYVTNIGATLNDGGSETTEAGDIGTIEITPAADNMLPSGITSPVILKPQANSYQECI